MKYVSESSKKGGFWFICWKRIWNQQPSGRVDKQPFTGSNFKSSSWFVCVTWSLLHNVILTIYTLTSVFRFSILLSIHFLRCWKGEFVQQSIAYLVGDHFLYSHDLKWIIQQYYCKEKLDAGHSECLKG